MQSQFRADGPTDECWMRGARTGGAHFRQFLREKRSSFRADIGKRVKDSDMGPLTRALLGWGYFLPSPHSRFLR